MTGSCQFLLDVYKRQVIAVGFRPAPSMAQELREEGLVVYEIGDGQQVSTILHAVWDGYEVGNNI